MGHTGYNGLLRRTGCGMAKAIASKLKSSSAPRPRVAIVRERSCARLSLFEDL